MHEVTLAQNNGAFYTVSDFTKFIDDAGSPLSLPSMRTRDFVANEAIARGNPVIFATPTTTVPLRVAKAPAVIASGVMVIGIATTTATAAGQQIEICTAGFCFAYVTGLSPAFGNRGTLDAATVGLVALQTAALDATTIVGSSLGHFLGAKLTVAPNLDLAPFWFQHV